MSALSIVRNENKAVILVANPLYLTSPFTAQAGGRVRFEVLEADAAGLKPLIGTKQLYYLRTSYFGHSSNPWNHVKVRTRHFL